MASESAEPLEGYRTRVEARLDGVFASLKQSPGDSITEAMAYAVCGKGKRLRPLLVYATGEMLSVKPTALDAAAMAVEMIHAYSLIHDDLPAMDDDDLRRGKPSCHIAFGEATAILAGDALQSLAFELLSRNQHGTAESNLKAIRVLSLAAGASGMVRGQVLDMDFEGRQPERTELEQMFQFKTGALFQAAIDMACAYAPELDQSVATGLRQFGLHIGLAFQIQDDILDVTADTQTLGKPQGSDIDQGKASYPARFGLENAKARVKELFDQALLSLEPFGDKAEVLKGLAKRLVFRDY